MNLPATKYEEEDRLKTWHFMEPSFCYRPVSSKKETVLTQDTAMTQLSHSQEEVLAQPRGKVGNPNDPNLC